MSRVLSALILAIALVGCVRRFEEPRPDEPHAIVKVRVVHHAQPGPSHVQAVRWSGYEIALRPLTASASGPAIETMRALRMRSELGEWSFQTRYFHTVTRTQMETQYRSESYSCGTETGGYGQSRYTRTRTCTRQVPHQVLVTRTVEVTDGQCRSESVHRPLVNGVYLMQFDYFGDDRCTLQCFRQLPATAGGFTLIPCGSGEPPGDPAMLTSGAESTPSPPPPPG